jgi:hypothetical protein
MNDLVQRLSQGEHAVEVSLRPERTVKALKDCLDRGFVHVRFTKTRGGTELGFAVDLTHSDLAGADFDAESGQLRIAGDLTLDWVKVRCIADLQLPSMEGLGHLEPLQQSVESAG